jgi:hypothetical protein
MGNFAIEGEPGGSMVRIRAPDRPTRFVLTLPGGALPFGRADGVGG